MVAFEDGMDYWVGWVFCFVFWMGVMTGRGGRGGLLVRRTELVFVEMVVDGEDESYGVWCFILKFDGFSKQMRFVTFLWIFLQS